MVTNSKWKVESRGMAAWWEKMFRNEVCHTCGESSKWLLHFHVDNEPNVIQICEECGQKFVRLLQVALEQHNFSLERESKRD